MTVLLVVLCRGGVVLGADQAMSSDESGLRLCETPTPKITILDDKLGAIATSGSVGAGQIARAALKPLPRGPMAAKLSPIDVLANVQKALASAPHSMLDALKAAQMMPANFVPGLKALSRATVGDGIYVQTVGKADGVLPVVVYFEGAHDAVLLEEGKLIFNSCGSGSVFAQPYMSVIRGLLFPDRLPTLEEGLLATYWALQHVIDYRAGGGVGGNVDLAVLELDAEKRLRMHMADAELLDRVKQMFADLNNEIREAFRAITDAGHNGGVEARPAPVPEAPKSTPGNGQPSPRERIDGEFSGASPLAPGTSAQSPLV